MKSPLKVGKMSFAFRRAHARDWELNEGKSFTYRCPSY
jgi:hypothetical protein